MQRKLIPLFCILFLHLTVWGQQTATLSGKVIDPETNTGLPLASVILQDESGQKNLSGSLTDQAGIFSISGINPGNFNIQISFPDYETIQIPVLIGENNQYYDLGRIELMVKDIQLDEVVIEARQAAISADLDKQSYQMDDQIAQSGGSVLDAMKNLPGVNVDQEGKLQLRGSDKVAVLIDGKPSSLTGFGNQKGLENIPASNIERIEIIHNPSSKYDAAGMAGIVNIVYKKERTEGLHGEVGFRYGLGELTTRKNDLPTQLGRFSLNPKYIPSLNLNYRTDKINTFFRAEVLRQKKLPNNEFHTRFYNDGTQTISQVPENRAQTQYILTGGIDRQISARSTLGFSAIFDYESHVDTAQVPYINMLTDQRYRYWHWSEQEVTGYMNYRLSYKYQFPQPGHELDIIGQYTRGWEDEKYLLNDSSEVRQSNDTTHIIAIEHTTAIQLDYTKPLRGGRLESGAKIQIRRIPVTYTIGQGEQSVIYPALGEWSRWGEDILAAYGTYIYEWKKWEVEAGLRLEQTEVFYELADENIYYNQNDSYNYFALFPNLRFSAKLNARNSFSLFYNRRVDRPGEPELRVFPKYDDPELLKVGNPYLRPQFTQNYSLAYRYSWKSGSIFLATYVRFIKDPFLRIFSIDEQSMSYDLVNKIYQNAGRARHTGLEWIFSQKVNAYWNLTASLNVFQLWIDAFEGEVLFPYVRPFSIDASTSLTSFFKLNNQIILPGQTQLQLSWVYEAPRNIPQGRQLARASLDLGLKKSFLHNKWEVFLSFTDILNQYGLRQEIQEGDVDILYENYYETQVGTLGLKMKF